MKTKPHPPERRRGKLNTLDTLSTLLFYFSILIFIIGFNFTDSPPPFGWYQQFMPNLNGASITDLTFTDSLNGYAVTNIGSSNSYIVKTTDGGDNWSINFVNNQRFARIEFINANTGFTNAFTTIFKTTNAGNTWSPISLPGIFGDDMFVLNQDTIWLAMSESLTGGVFLTTNGGVSWVQQLNLGSANPSHIYMFNARIGFISPSTNNGTQYTRKTTNGGTTWDTLINQGFVDIYFTDSLMGWRARGNNMYKTIDGGYNWITQILPYGGYFVNIGVYEFSNINADTIWGVGGWLQYPNFQSRGVLYRTTNGGSNWLFQIPDTTINIHQYVFNKFTNKLNGWAYAGFTGVHTVTGGGDTTYSGIKRMSSFIPDNFVLEQNYPNPFNPSTFIRFQIKRLADVRLVIYDVTGKEIKVLINQKQKGGVYEVSFEGSGYSSGVYFYSLIIDEKLIDTKKMILLK